MFICLCQHVDDSSDLETGCADWEKRGRDATLHIAQRELDDLGIHRIRDVPELIPRLLPISHVSLPAEDDVDPLPSEADTKFVSMRIRALPAIAEMWRRLALCGGDSSRHQPLPWSPPGMGSLPMAALVPTPIVANRYAVA